MEVSECESKKIMEGNLYTWGPRWHSY